MSPTRGSMQTLPENHRSYAYRRHCLVIRHAYVFCQLLAGCSRYDLAFLVVWCTAGIHLAEDSQFRQAAASGLSQIRLAIRPQRGWRRYE